MLICGGALFGGLALVLLVVWLLRRKNASASQGVTVQPVSQPPAGRSRWRSCLLVAGALFLLVGMIYERRHTKKIEDFGGLGPGTWLRRRLSWLSSTLPTSPISSNPWHRTRSASH